MKKSIFKKFVLSAAVVSCAFMLSGTPADAGQYFPKKEIKLTGDVLTLGDVFENVPSSAGHVLAPAPAPGKTMILSAYDLQRISNAFHLGWRPQNQVERSIVLRVGNTVSTGRITEALQSKLEQDMKGHIYEIDLNKQHRDIIDSTEEQPQLDITAMDFDADSGLFKATITMTTDKASKTVDVRGTAHRMVEVPVLSKRLRSGDLITASDLDIVKMRLANVPANAILDESKIIGKTPRRYVEAARAIHPESLSAPLAIKKGEHVTLHLSNGILSLTTKGKALENGAKGDMIRVVNTESNRVIEGTVIGPQSIQVTGSTL